METKYLLIDYINSVSDLAESLQRDIIKGREYSSETVLKLSKFVAAAERFRDLQETLEATLADDAKNLN